MGILRNGDVTRYKMYHNGIMQKKGYHNSTVNIYSAGSTVTYIVDVENEVKEEVDSGASCLSPKTFTPSKSGWTFVGWREDTTASADVLTEKLMDDEPITLYAVFEKEITCTFISGLNKASSATAKGNLYYNNGNIANASVTAPTGVTVSGWTWIGWSGDTIADGYADIANGGNIVTSADGTLYGLYQQTITLSYNGNGSTSGSTASQTGTRYHNSYGNYSDPEFKLASNGFARTNYTFAVWAQGSANGTQYKTGASVTLTASTTFFAYWVQSVTNFGYTGGIQTFTAPVAGTYKLVCYGAQGGTYRNVGGYGGYAYGNVALSKGQTIYVVVGGVPYNGGGNCTGAYASKGGGATHMAKRTGLLSTLNSYRSDVIIVAGGGGGGGDYGTGGTGGGASGGNGNGAGGGRGATQSTGYAFGKARDEAGDNNICGGGGGYFGGYEGQDTVEDSSDTGGGGGGSGYTGGCISGTTGMSNGQKSGNGSASITFVSAA